jgi:hypothetical protein
MISKKMISDNFGYPLQGTDCNLTKKMLGILTAKKKIYLIPATYRDQLIARFVICGVNPKQSDIDFAWDEIVVAAEEVLGIKKLTNEDEILAKTDGDKVADKITSTLLISP